MPEFRKHAADSSLASSTGATAAAPVPTPSVDPTFAPGKRGPMGVSPRQNYSRVNTGAPPQADAGAAEQKSMSPRGAEMLPKRAAAGEELMGKMAGRPMLQDLVKAAMVESADRVRISEEARLQSVKTAEEKCGECGMEKHSGPCKTEKKGSMKLAGQHVTKLASALDFCAEYLLKQAEMPPPPGVSQATASTPLPDHKGQGVHVVPMHPGSEKGLKGEHTPTKLETNLEHAPGGKQEMIQRNYGGKHASVVDVIRAKLAEHETPAEEKKEMSEISAAKKNIEKLEEHEKKEHEENRKEGFAVTERGHEYDAAMNELKARHASEQQALHDHFTGGRFGLTTEATKHIQEQGGATPKGSIEQLLNLVRFGGGADMPARHHAYTAEKHRKGENAWNPLGGTLTPTKHEVGATPGLLGTMGAYKSKAPEMPKEGSIAAYMAQRVKQAEDAINPAQISAGPAVPPETSASGEAGGTPVGGAPQGPTGLVGSNESARDYNRGEAYKNRKEDLKKYFDEPAMSAEHDKVLQVAFENTGKAGPKIASAQAPAASVKTAAARVLLSQLAESIDEKQTRAGV